MIHRIANKARALGVTGVLGACLSRIRKKLARAHPVEKVLPRLIFDDEAVIVQVGAFEGATGNDPLYRLLREHGNALANKTGTYFKLILVEPMITHFTRLRANYSFLPAARFENVAISDHCGEIDFYYLGVSPEDYGFPSWLAQLSSVKRERMEEMWNNYEANDEYKEFYLAHRIKTTVQCITVEELLVRHKIKAVSLLQIDAEGSEFDILSSLPFEEFAFRFINFESVLLGQNKTACQLLLHEQGYRMVDYGQDTFCYRAEDEWLFPRWVRLAAKNREQMLNL
jgi:FkbM family methyltransferase